jgi:hypothetical protein
VRVEVGNEKTNEPFDGANDIAKWLNLHKPHDVDEIDALIEMVTEFEPGDDYFNRALPDSRHERCPIDVWSKVHAVFGR